ncbi:unnamed protein product [Eruca vesicaria subsp. sativa]|uniref:Uncharacterized protein n=1 Tax=Eruca vesicaria subsp. sativa TaxID=29727 RepID=A0ABC8J7C9_ERUVS|nr:unnamed protein product [Eruca vesicaria subsp. sativa]
MTLRCHRPRLRVLSYDAFGVGSDTPLALTYHWPEWMLVPNGPRPQPVNISETRDVEVMMSLSDFRDVLILFVTSSAEEVARYQFYCRTSFLFGNTRFLGPGVLESAHRQFIRDMSGNRPFSCATRMLEMVCTQPQLLDMYHMSLEIQLALSTLPGNDGMNIAPVYNPIPLQTVPPNRDYEVPIGIPVATQLNHQDHPSDIFRGSSLDIERSRSINMPHSPHTDIVDDANNWEDDHVVATPTDSQPPLHQPSSFIIRLSSDITPVPSPPHTKGGCREDAGVGGSSSDSSDEIFVVGTMHGNSNPVPTMKYNVVETLQTRKKCFSASPTYGMNAGGPSLDLSLGFGGTNTRAAGNSVVIINDSSSEVAGDNGGCRKKP